MLLKARCPSLWASFGLNSEYVEKSIYEEIVFLQHYGHFTFTEAYNLPVALRAWFVEKNLSILEEQNKSD
jgi:hypothetical protein